MRKVIYSVGASVDGYIAAPDGSVDWLDRATSKAKGDDFGLTAFFKSIDTVLMGRKTYEHAKKMGMGAGHPGAKNYIFSRTLPPGLREGVEFVNGSVSDLIKNIRKSPGKHIWLCGGGELAREALEERVVDEITIGLTPILIGDGRPTFPPVFTETELELVECKQYRGGVLGLTYRVVISTKPERSKKQGAKRPRRR